MGVGWPAMKIPFASFLTEQLLGQGDCLGIIGKRWLGRGREKHDRGEAIEYRSTKLFWSTNSIDRYWYYIYIYICIYHIYLPWEPNNPWNLKVLHPQYMGEITTKNEGFWVPMVRIYKTNVSTLSSSLGRLLIFSTDFEQFRNNVNPNSKKGYKTGKTWLAME